MSRIIVIGDSHAGTIRRALLDHPDEKIASRNVAPGRISDEFMVRTYAGDPVINPVVLTALHNFKLYNPWRKEFNSSDADVVFLFGSAESHRFTMHEDWVRFGVEGETTTDPLLPIQMVRDALDERLSLLFKGMQTLKDTAPWRLALMLGPPPHRDTEFIELRRPEWGGTVPPPERRLLIWSVIKDSLTSFAESAGIRMHDFTKSVSDADGFLLQKYQSDGVHGNAVYGADVAQLLKAAHE